jgi:hypothetical protein
LETALGVGFTFFATAVKVYVVSLVSPVTSQSHEVPSPFTEVVQVAPPGLAVISTLVGAVPVLAVVKYTGTF